MLEEHASMLFQLVDRSRRHLRTWLPWVDAMHSAEHFQQFIRSARTREEEGLEASWLIFYNGVLAGRIGIHYINQQNKQGSIGYWLGQDFEGKGIVTQACEKVIAYGFDTLCLNRIELKCGTCNQRSAAIPNRLGFTKEGVLREAELVNGVFIDLYLFSLLRHEWPEKVPSTGGGDQ
jgi:ribosomal-protein-serine acetyltransferase